MWAGRRSRRSVAEVFIADCPVLGAQTTASDKHTFLESPCCSHRRGQRLQQPGPSIPVASSGPIANGNGSPFCRHCETSYLYSPWENTHLTRTTGPAYWLRCIIARKIPHPSLQDGQVPVLYLPGHSRSEFRIMESCPPKLQPLAELQYRGILWSQRNGKDWTIGALLQSKEGGLGIDVGLDTSTKEALQRSLLKLARRAIGIAPQGGTPTGSLP